MIVVAALYQFKNLDNCPQFRLELKDLCNGLKIKGTLILADEGINGTVAGSRESIDSLVNFLKNDKHFANLEYKESFSEKQPFFRMKVKYKKEIVTMSVGSLDVDRFCGTYVSPKDWNDLINNPEVITIDTRNYYEIQIGTFKNAINPNTNNFPEFSEYVDKNLLDKKNKKIAMFCTGGIRCEKSTAYLKSIGFENVYHLKGGILKYLEEVPESDSMWQGECFVFDQRVAVTHGLAIGTMDKCHGCRMPLSDDDKKSEHYLEGIYCHYCYNKMPEEHYARACERHKQMVLAKQRNYQHIGNESHSKK
jgi:UPF0176 protein